MVGQPPPFGVTPSSSFGGFGTNSWTGFGGFGTNNSTAGFGASSSFNQPTFRTQDPAASSTSFNTENSNGKTGVQFGSFQATDFGAGGLFGNSHSQTNTSGGIFGSSSTSNLGTGNQSQNNPFRFAPTASSSAGLFGSNNNAGGTNKSSTTFEYLRPPFGHFSFGIPSTASNNAATVNVSFSLDAQGGKDEKRFSDEKKADVKFVPLEGGFDTMTRSGLTTNISTKICVITAMKEYENMSIEELRLKDYLSGVKNSTPEENKPFGFKFESTKGDCPKPSGNFIRKPYEESGTEPFGTNFSCSNAKQRIKTNNNLFGSTTWNLCEKNIGPSDYKMQEFKPFCTTNSCWRYPGKHVKNHDKKPLFGTTSSWDQFGKENGEVFGANGNKFRFGTNFNKSLFGTDEKTIFGTSSTPWIYFENKESKFNKSNAESESNKTYFIPKERNNKTVIGPVTKPGNFYNNQNKPYFIKPQDNKGVSWEENHMSKFVEITTEVPKKIATICNDLKEYMDSYANNLVLESMRNKEERIKELERAVKDLELEKEMLKNFTHPAQLYGDKAYMNIHLPGCCSLTQRDMNDMQESILRLRTDMNSVKNVLNKYEKGEFGKDMVVGDYKCITDVSMNNWGFRLPRHSTACEEQSIQEFKSSIKHLEEEMKLLKINADELKEKSTKYDNRQKDSSGAKTVNCHLCSSVVEAFNIATVKDKNIQGTGTVDGRLEPDLMATKDFDKPCNENSFRKSCCEKLCSDQGHQKPNCGKHFLLDEYQHTSCCKHHSSKEDHEEICCKRPLEDQRVEPGSKFLFGKCPQKLFLDKSSQRLCCEKRSLKDQDTSPERDQRTSSSKRCSPNRTRLETHRSLWRYKDDLAKEDQPAEKSSRKHLSLKTKKQELRWGKGSPDQRRSCVKDLSTDTDRQNDIDQRRSCIKDLSTDTDRQKSCCKYHSLDEEHQPYFKKRSPDKDQLNLGCNDDDDDKSVRERKHCDAEPDLLKESDDDDDAGQTLISIGKLKDKWCDWYENEDDWP